MKTNSVIKNPSYAKNALKKQWPHFNVKKKKISTILSRNMVSDVLKLCLKL